MFKNPCAPTCSLTDCLATKLFYYHSVSSKYIAILSMCGNIDKMICVHTYLHIIINKNILARCNTHCYCIRIFYHVHVCISSLADTMTLCGYSDCIVYF